VNLVTPHHCEGYTKQNIKCKQIIPHEVGLHVIGRVKYLCGVSISPHNQMVQIVQSSSAFKRFAEKVGMAISVAIGCLEFDKRKDMMSLLESRNDVVRCDQRQRYKFIVNGT
jgi:hypothetical protein